jgi:Fic family protein
MPGIAVPRIWPSDSTRDAPKKHRAACSYTTFTPAPLADLRVSLDLALAGLVADAEHELRQLNVEGGAALLPLSRLLLRTESIASSKVEGLHLEARSLAKAEAKSAEGQKIGDTAREVLASMDAMTIALERAATAERIDEGTLLEIHRRLMEHSARRHIAGRFRTGQNWIGGNDYTPCDADFCPPPIDELPGLLDDLYSTIDGDTLPPIAQAALVHAQFETIHPFDDGNGRTGRALIHLVLRRREVAPHFVPPISVVFANNRDRYISGLTTFRGDDVTAWIEVFAESTIRAARLARRYLAKVSELKSEWTERLQARPQIPRADASAWRIIDLLIAHPIITAPMATAALGRTPAVIYEGIDQLVQARVLAPLTEGKRNRSWEAIGLLDLIEAMDRGE